MGFFRRIAGLLGFLKDDHNEHMGDADDESDERPSSRVRMQETGLPRKGFSVQVAVDRPLGPVIVPCNNSDGGVQGLRWYTKRLRIDEDGDVADEFIDEVITESPTISEHHHKPAVRFKVNYGDRPAKVRGQFFSLDGKFQHCVEHQGKLQWV